MSAKDYLEKDYYSILGVGKDVDDAVSSQWTAYRQALRDISDQTGFPTNIQWPQKPN